MKKYSVIVALAMLVFTSCSDFLDSFPSYAVDPNMSVADAEAEALTNACYTPLQSSNLYNQRIWSLDIIAGNSIVGAGGGDDGIETIQCANFAAASDNGFALYIWRSPWVGIGQCNIVINSLPGSQASAAVRDRSLGEAYFLRAHYYYILVRLFGGVPLKLKPHEATDPMDIERRSLDECYVQLIEDCKRAVTLLPSRKSYLEQDRNRVSKEAAMTMLADIYLTYHPEEHYSEVVSLCEEIASLGGYNLEECPYEDNFGIRAENSREAIFTVGYSGSTKHNFWGSDNQSSWLSTFMGPRNSNMVAGGYGWNQPTDEFMSQWEEGDLRKAVTVLYRGCPDFGGMSYNANWSNTGYNVRKFLVEKKDSPDYNTNPSDFVVYRFADVLLKKAEALNELGEKKKAAEALNIVRRRVGLPEVSADQLTREQMREKIIHERRMELAFEGHRWFDMVRIQNGDYALQFLASLGKTVTRERLLLPIPLTEMDSNHLMEQNPGY